MRRDSECGAPSAGNALIVALVVMTMLVALAAAQFTVVQKNLQASSYYLAYSDLHKYAESGLSMALHDLAYNAYGTGGKIGTVDWTSADDVGRDGIGGTYDQGEGDGIPTVGEPNVHPSLVGAFLDTGLIVYTDGTSHPGILRIVASASSHRGTATVETFVRRTVATLPRVASVFVDPEAVLDLKGNSFLIDGNDHNPDGTAGSAPAVPGIATLEGSPPGANAATFLSQIPAKNYDQVRGAGSLPSLGEAGGVDIAAIFDSFKSRMTQTLAPGTYTSPALGDWTDPVLPITYASGDLHFSGNGHGAGVLLVDGTVTVTGQFTFYGMLIVRGDIRLSGGGAGVHTYGTVMVGQSLTAVDPESDVTITGTADLFYSAAVLARLEDMLAAKYTVVYYDEK